MSLPIPLANWLLLIKNEKSAENIDLAIALLPTLMEENASELPLVLAAAYWGTITRADRAKKEPPLHAALRECLKKCGFRLEELLNFDHCEWQGKEVPAIAKKWQPFEAEYAQKQDIKRLYLLMFEQISPSRWLMLLLLDAYQKKAPIALSFSTEEWRIMLRGCQMYDGKSFFMPYDYDEGGLGVAPDVIYELEELEELRISYWSEISPQIYRLKNLRKLIFEVSFFEESTISLDLRQFPLLEELSIHAYQYFPQLSGSDSLQVLQLDNEGSEEQYKNQALPAAIAEMPKLRKLSLSRMRRYEKTWEKEPIAQPISLFFTYVDADFLANAHFLAFRRCRLLKLNCYSSKKLPPQLSEFSEIEQFDCNGSISSFPHLLLGWQRLRRLTMTGHTIAQMSEYVIKTLLSRLEYLEIYATIAIRTRIERIYEQMREESATNCELIFR